jgi:hypothetical protein
MSNYAMPHIGTGAWEREQWISRTGYHHNWISRLVLSYIYYHHDPNKNKPDAFVDSSATERKR